MSGYCGYSKSNNAVEAEHDYKFPVTTLCRLYGLRKDLVNLTSPCEWHHSSKYFNVVHYYDARDCVRSRDLKNLSITRPSAVHIYNRLVVKLELIEEAAGYERFKSLRSKINSKLQELDWLADEEIAKNEERKRRRYEAKRQAKEAAFKAQIEIERREASKSYAAALRRRCQSTGLTASNVKELLALKPSPDPTCIQSQVRKWFNGLESQVDIILDEVA